ncbi:hypothetical protein L227DRAFT_573328 [Lentinus tigrinus ALCF2SS1-6]|uniref:Uncharacterized protein n=1 Tax=Lentinus tigrinus ALCF2SS1-6 TaxID=1328759 RepID=A0A5C2SHT0_9APHY|nr:hypothetical protein L227DRAFT_573328 [Lentinus tigrinus ALCF2SS1-6]
MSGETHAVVPTLEVPSTALPSETERFEANSLPPTSPDAPASYPPLPEPRDPEYYYILGWPLDQEWVQEELRRDGCPNQVLGLNRVVKTMWDKAMKPDTAAYEHYHVTSTSCFAPEYIPVDDVQNDRQETITTLAICHSSDPFYDLRPTQGQYERLQAMFRGTPSWYRSAVLDVDMMKLFWEMDGIRDCCKRDRRHLDIIRPWTPSEWAQWCPEEKDADV